MKTEELQAVIEKINREQNFDLAWRWEGNLNPYILVFEEADSHVLATGELHNIEKRLREALPGWGLEYPE